MELMMLSTMHGNSDNWSDWRKLGDIEAAFPCITLRRNAVGGIGVIVVNKRNRAVGPPTSVDLGANNYPVGNNLFNL